MATTWCVSFQTLNQAKIAIQTDLKEQFEGEEAPVLEWEEETEGFRWTATWANQIWVITNTKLQEMGDE